MLWAANEAPGKEAGIEALKKNSFVLSPEIIRAFGTYIERDGLSWRATFIVDPDGILKSLEIHDNNIGRTAKEILRKLQAAKFVREHKGQVCPAS